MIVRKLAQFLVCVVLFLTLFLLAVWATDWQHRTPIQCADFWNETTVVEILGRAMQLKHNPAKENCGMVCCRDVLAIF